LTHRAAGADVGATLAKLALREADGTTTTESLPSHALERVVERLAAHAPAWVGLTGGGGARLAAKLGMPSVAVDEFGAWAAGARLQMAHDGELAERFLLVSVGTGSSAMLVEPGAVTRVGGSALGGGTILGLGAALVGERDFDAIARLAARGDRRRVDLSVADIYPHGSIPLPGGLNAASFGKLARSGEPPPGAADLAHGIMGLVGENLGLICAGLALRFDVERVVFGGSTLLGNPALTEILGVICAALGRAPSFPTECRYAGALGALALAADARA
jgi:type II pantothenate kinase